MKQQYFRTQAQKLPPHVALFILTGDERRDWVNPVLDMAKTAAIVSGKAQVSSANIHAIHPVDAARNSAYEQMKEFERKSGRNVEWMIMFDNDIGPPLNFINFLDDVPAEADIVIFPYYVWLPEGEMPMVCIGDWRNEQMVTRIDLKPNAWNEVHVGGTGAMLIRRRVFTDGRLKPPFFKIIADEVNGQTTSEDIWFTARAHKAGFRIFTHTGYVCSHFRTTDLAKINAAVCNILLAYVEKIRERCEAAGVHVGDLSSELRPELIG